MSHLFGRTGDSCSYDGDDVLPNHIAPLRVSVPPSMISWSSIQAAFVSTVHVITRVITVDCPRSVIYVLNRGDNYGLARGEVNIYIDFGSQIYEWCLRSPLETL